MSEENKSALVPQLRFPEFREAEEWEVRELGALCRIRTGKKDANEGCENGLYPFFTCAERHIFSNTYSFDAEAILIAGNANVGQAKYYKGKFEAYQRTYVLTDFAQVSVPYLYLYLRAQLSEALARQVQTSAMSYIKLPMLETYKVPSPNAPEEQQKIADCLSSLDELITAETQKLDALKTHKKGLMQQLFPREGETVPRLRFSEFLDAQAWEHKELGEISAVVASGDLDAAYFSPIKTNEHIYPVYSNAVEELGLYGYYSLSKYPRDSITITARGTLGVAFARSHEFMGIGRLLVVSNFKDIDPRFICECWNHLGKVPAEVTSIPQFTAVAAKATSLPIPAIEEQHKIADCLSSIDDLLTAQSQRINALKNHKKGLMQQLFPVLDEVQA